MYIDAFKIADDLSRERGYDGYSSIDDPILREWIWNIASNGIKNYSIDFHKVFLCTTVFVIFLIGVLVGKLI